MNSVLFFSQAKSLYLGFAKGDWTAARQVQQEFLAKSLVLSQLWSLSQFVLNKSSGTAMAIQMQFLQPLNLCIQTMALLGLCLGPVFLMIGIHGMGFEDFGIRSGSMAARWMASFHGNIPKDGLFSHLQAIGIKGVLPFSWSLSASLMANSISAAIAAVCSIPLVPKHHHQYESIQDVNDVNADLIMPRSCSPVSVD